MIVFAPYCQEQPVQQFKPYLMVLAVSRMKLLESLGAGSDAWMLGVLRHQAALANNWNLLPPLSTAFRTQLRDPSLPDRTQIRSRTPRVNMVSRIVVCVLALAGLAAAQMPVTVSRARICCKLCRMPSAISAPDLACTYEQ